MLMTLSSSPILFTTVWRVITLLGCQHLSVSIRRSVISLSKPKQWNKWKELIGVGLLIAWQIAVKEQTRVSDFQTWFFSLLPQGQIICRHVTKNFRGCHSCWDLRSSGMLCNVNCSVTDVSWQGIRPILKGAAGTQPLTVRSCQHMCVTPTQKTWPILSELFSQRERTM